MSLPAALKGRSMAKKKSSPEPEGPLYVTVKLGKAEHAKLRTVAAGLGRDQADVLTEIVRGPLDKMWKAEVARLNEQANEGR